MKILVGLGNPGNQYEKTRHNIGFLCVEHLISEHGFSPWKTEKKFFGQIAFAQIKEEKCVALKPDTYMNLSGKSVSALAQFYKRKPSDIWVFSDDIDLPFGTVRFRQKGQSGGHNGLKSIIESLGSSEFNRIKIGIENEQKEQRDTSDFVLGRFTPEEQKLLPDLLQKAGEVFLKVF